MVEFGDFVPESLPMGLCMVGVKLGISIISLLNQAEVRCCLKRSVSVSVRDYVWSTYIVKALCFCGWVILLEETRDSGIFEVPGSIGLSHHDNERGKNGSQKQEGTGVRVSLFPSYEKST
jgi:hypothetical protein